MPTYANRKFQVALSRNIPVDMCLGIAATFIVIFFVQTVGEEFLLKIRILVRVLVHHGKSNTRSSFRVALDLPFNVFAHTRLITLLEHQHMVRNFADPAIADAMETLPTDSVCADAFPGAVHPTFRNRRGGSRSARFPICCLVLVQRVGQRGAPITLGSSSITQILCGCYGVELVAEEKSATQVRSKFRKRYCLRLHRA
jgi:hypothetical protein